MDKLKAFSALGSEFIGMDLSFRQDGTGWPKKWRAKCHASNMEQFRIEVWGDTADEAIEALLEAVRKARG